MTSAREALDLLREGNRRFASGTRRHDVLLDPAWRAELANKTQKPLAIVLGCSDSRVPVEMVFDQGLGDLFVIRVAGNIVASSQLGSVEFAAEQLGTRLVVVMGHSQCGAVAATLQDMRRPPESQSPYLRALVEHIRPAVEQVLQTEPTHDIDALMRLAVRANVAASVFDLRRGSEVLQKLMRDDGLIVIGSEYSLDTGVVEFFDGETT